MNLTRMRQFGWEKYVVPIYQEYKSKIVWGDQDIINIVFHFYAEKLYVYPCHYNYRPDHWYVILNATGGRALTILFYFQYVHECL